MEASRPASLEGFRIVSFESRRAKELAELLRRYGADPIVAPSMREIPLSENIAALDFLSELEGGKIDFVIFLTGVGTRTLAEAAASHYSRERLASALAKARLVARGPKPVAALKELGLKPDISAPEPNTWREILSELDGKAELRGKRVAVQEYGISNQELLAGLEARGAEVRRVPVYRWALPEDTRPLRSALHDVIDGRMEIALFTNATQVVHLFRLATEEGVEQALRKSLSLVVVASVGPVCSEALVDFGVAVDVEPEHPKMGYLVTAVAERAAALLAAKRERKV